MQEWESLILTIIKIYCRYRDRNEMKVANKKCMIHLGLFALVILCSLNQAASEVYHMSADLCTAPLPCLSLTQFAANSSGYLHSNTTLVFLPGTHYLTVRLTVSNVHYFSMHPENTAAKIMCRNSSAFSFTHS